MRHVAPHSTTNVTKTERTGIWRGNCSKGAPEHFRFSVQRPRPQVAVMARLDPDQIGPARFRRRLNLKRTRPRPGAPFEPCKCARSAGGVTGIGDLRLEACSLGKACRRPRRSTLDLFGFRRFLAGADASLQPDHRDDYGLPESDRVRLIKSVQGGCQLDLAPRRPFSSANPINADVPE